MSSIGCEKISSGLDHAACEVQSDRKESTTFQAAQLTSPKRFACANTAAAVSRRRKRQVRRMRMEWEVVEVFAFTGPHHRDHNHGLSLTAFSRHLSDRLSPPLAVRDASPKHGLPEPCLSMPAAGSQKAPRVSPFRSGCGRNDAAKGGDGDGRGRIFPEVAENEGGVDANYAHRLEHNGEQAPSSDPSGHLLPGGEKKCAEPAVLFSANITLGKK
ncbi:hypothetical protein J2854_003746 [Agrobacterium tumefaciens]|nr:hypothetical protein [Agrobacterium tumefaciens]